MPVLTASLGDGEVCLMGILDELRVEAVFQSSQCTIVTGGRSQAWKKIAIQSCTYKILGHIHNLHLFQNRKKKFSETINQLKIFTSFSSSFIQRFVSMDNTSEFVYPVFQVSFTLC